MRAEIPALLALATLACNGVGRDGSTITTSGHVEATEVRVSTKVAGTLESFALQEGDRVAAGQEIARLDTTDTALALAAARADLGQAQAELRLRLAGSRREDVAEAETQVRRAEADLSGAEKDLARMQGLLDSGSGTTKARDDARTRRDVAAAALAGARERLTRLRTGFRVEEKDAARARVEAAEARVAQFEQQMKDAVVVSPVAGIVTEKLVERGELLSRGAALAVITDLAEAWLTVYLPEPDLARVRIGQEAEVAADDGKTVRKGRLNYVASQAEFTPKNAQTRDERVKLVYRLKIGLPNEDGAFKPGMPAEARLLPAGPASGAGR